jgi:hypothetical protein
MAHLLEVGVTRGAREGARYDGDGIAKDTVELRNGGDRGGGEAGS